MGSPPSAAHHRELALGETADLEACSRGIAWVRQALTDWGLLAQGQDALLIAAELLSNAVKHAGGIRRLTLTHRDGLLRVAVTDPSPEPPRLRAHRPDSIGGHGVFLVDRLAQRWGTRPNGRGKTVWATLALPR
ncbi:MULTISPECIES: ATP-binding protein [Streptomyces]|uniref:ATP-binding protein n=1 Tax=Streptomyces virginiae TaxID=1961 RepID=A0ABQ3NPS1_STRVG|nr:MULTISPECIES: ATP-binding protein [Streptomyces]MBP2341404.1 anti-sigma regulatory factor (Ser/Thr protein kinase) [Streptomyces virginiae]GGQ07143.1 ATP-binding protein [Streptomyces virginiae]GHI14732.1 ATP-binding protein [Streptomyces virginiae]